MTKTSTQGTPSYDYGDDYQQPDPRWPSERAPSGRGRWPFPADFIAYMVDDMLPYYDEVLKAVTKASEAKRKAWALNRRHPLPWPATPSKLALHHIREVYGLTMMDWRTVSNMVSRLRKLRREFLQSKTANISVSDLS